MTGRRLARLESRVAGGSSADVDRALNQAFAEAARNGICPCSAMTGIMPIPEHECFQVVFMADAAGIRCYALPTGTTIADYV